jgi:hypothetical protein
MGIDLPYANVGTVHAVLATTASFSVIPISFTLLLVFDAITRILCFTRTVEHNYILPSNTVRIKLHVSALYVGHLQVVI